MKQYEDKKFELWREQVETHLLSYLKRNLLTRSSTGSATTRSGGHTAKDDVGADDDHISPVHSKCFAKSLRESGNQTCKLWFTTHVKISQLVNKMCAQHVCSKLVNKL